MTHTASLRLQCILLLALSLEATIPGQAYAAPPGADPMKEGKDLAVRLTSSLPTEDAEFTGQLEIKDKEGRIRSVPLSSKITLGAGGWKVAYHTLATNAVSAETLTISHQPNQPPTYSLTVANQPAAAEPLNRPFAGSDFWLLDLGLGFFHWPEQRLLRSEMSLGRACRVLESTAPQALSNGYARVVSWIDLDSGGLLQAEAFDRSNRLLKKFKVGSFKKVAGRWQLRDMKIRNAQTGQQTELKFDLKNSP